MWIITTIFVVILVIAGCVISPRRIVSVNPSPTPTPTVSPTPTPTPTPTPSPMAATVPAQFLFLGQTDAPLVTAFRINGNGSLTPVAASPFSVSAPARALKSVGDTLTITSDAGVAAFTVDRTGSIHEATSAESLTMAADPSSSANIGPQLAVLDSQGRFMFVADLNRSALLAFRNEDGKLVALPGATVPISGATSSIAIVKP